MRLDAGAAGVVLLAMRATVLASLCLIALGGAAQADCPASPDLGADLQRLIGAARSAPDQATGRDLSGQMWTLWLRAPDEAAQAALDAGMRRREAYDFAGAIKEYDRLVTYCPRYAEGYNQRAFAYFLQGSFDRALADLDIALHLQPLHVAAQAGRALTLMNLGRIAEARTQLLEAVGNNPWLSERALLAEGAPLGPSDREL